MREIPRVMDLIEQGQREGLHIGAQLAASIDLQPVVDLAVGESRAGTQMTADTNMLWASATKPVTAVVIAQLWERGDLQLDDRVADHLPAFGAGGKSEITIRHLLTHTSGITQIGQTAAFANEWREVVGSVCASPLQPDWVPGQRAAYGPAGWIALAAVAEQATGQSYGDLVRKTIYEPLRMEDAWIGMPPERHRAYGGRIGVMHDTSGDAPRPLPIDDELPASRCNPAGGGRGRMRDLLRLYEMLLNGGTLDGARIISPQTVEALTAPHRVGIVDELFQSAVPWGLGFVTNAAIPDGGPVPDRYGPHASRRTFGHGGMQSSVGFADPECGLAVAVVFNGMPGRKRHLDRIESVLGALYQDLGLAA